MGGPSSDSESEESKSKNEADGAADDGSQGARRQGGRGAERGWTRSARLVEGKLGSVDLTVVRSETIEPPIVRVEEVDVRGSMANEDDVRRAGDGVPIRVAPDSRRIGAECMWMGDGRVVLRGLGVGDSAAGREEVRGGGTTKEDGAVVVADDDLVVVVEVVEVVEVYEA